MAGPQRNRAPRRAVVCACPRVTHEHGTYPMYKRCGCRCEPCTRASREYAAALVIRHAAGTGPRFVPVGPVLKHIEQLRAAGLGFKRIGELAGVPARMIQVIITGRRSNRDGPQKTVRAETAEKIMAIKPSPRLVAGRRLIDATGTRRRLQALVAAGWSRARLAHHTGMQPSTIGHLTLAENCTLAAARTIHAVYEQLWDQAPPASTSSQRGSVARARADARARGWVLPMFWDEESIDDPSARPVVMLAQRATAVDRLDELVWMLSAGESIEEATRRAGYRRVSSAWKAAHRHGHHAAELLRATWEVAA